MNNGNAAPLLPFGESAPRTLDEVHADLSREMARLHRQDADLYTKAAALFKDHQQAKTDPAAAEVLLAAVLAFTAPVNTPFPAPEVVGTPEVPVVEPAVQDIPAAPEPATPDAESERVPADAPIDEEDPSLEEDNQGEQAENSAEDTGSDEDTSPDEDVPAQEQAPTNATAAAPQVDPTALEEALAAPLTVTPVTWPDGTVGAGMLSQLARTLQAGDMLSLILTRVGNQLLVTVQPTPLKDEPASTALQVKGTPAALDTVMLPRLEEYRQGRDLARATVDYAAKIKAAAEAHQKATLAAAKKNLKPGATTPKPSTSSASGSSPWRSPRKTPRSSCRTRAGKRTPSRPGSRPASPPGSTP